MKKRLFLIPFFLLIALLCSSCAMFGTSQPITMPTQAELNMQARALTWQAKGLDFRTTKLALEAYYRARVQGHGQKHTLTIIDYSKPSSIRRFWVFDLQTNKLLYHELVAHGKNSGDKYATSFSDTVNSLQSSIGLYVTEPKPYVGKYGYSLRLRGLERGFNGNAARRAIVVHGADYVSDSFVAQNGRLGLSWGCPALPRTVSSEVINNIKGGSLIFAYYPDRRWLKQSKYLNS